MGRLGRGALWMLFAPAGFLASLRAGRRKDTQRIVDAIERRDDPRSLARAAAAGELEDELDAQERRRLTEIRHHRRDVLTRLKAAGVPRQQRDAAYLAVADLVGTDNMTIDAAVREVVRRRLGATG